MIASPEPIVNNEFSKNVRIPISLDWRETNNIYLEKVPYDHQSSKYVQSIELFALDYINRNFVSNDIIVVRPPSANKDFTLVIHKFYNLFSANKTGICALLHGYPLYYHASLLKCNVDNLRNCKDENRVIVFHSKLNLVLIARIAHSLDDIKSQSNNCLNDIILFYNVNSLFIEASNLIILGIVVLPSVERKELKEEFFFLFSDSWSSSKKLSYLEQILFLCKDDFEDENFIRWWSLVATFSVQKVNYKSDNKIFFKTLIGLTMIVMAYSGIIRVPTLKNDPHKQIESLILNNKQWNAIYDTGLKKIITGEYGSGKSVVANEIVKNCIQNVSENPFTLYYICCNHFSLFECEMRQFVDSIEKTSNCTVVCDNLYELWKAVCTNKGIEEKCISISKLLEYLVVTNNDKVCFVLEELSPDYVKEEDVVQLNNLFLSVLKESLVVFIPESSELIRNNEKHLLQNNYFIENELNMKVFVLNKSI